jgi:hypothetical protein
MEGRDEGLSILNAEGVDRGAVFLADARALQTRCRVALLRVVAVAKREGATERADRVVVRLLIPMLRVGDLQELRMSDSEERQLADVGPPDVIEDLAMRGQGELQTLQK